MEYMLPPLGDGYTHYYIKKTYEVWTICPYF